MFSDTWPKKHKNIPKSGVPKKSEKIPDFLKIREKKSGGTENTRNSRSQCLVTLGRDKTQRNPIKINRKKPCSF